MTREAECGTHAHRSLYTADSLVHSRLCLSVTVRHASLLQVVRVSGKNLGAHAMADETGAVIFLVVIVLFFALLAASVQPYVRRRVIYPAPYGYGYETVSYAPGPGSAVLPFVGGLAAGSLLARPGFGRGGFRR